MRVNKRQYLHVWTKQQLFIYVQYLLLWHKSVSSQTISTKDIVLPIKRGLQGNKLIQLMFSKTMSQVNMQYYYKRVANTFYQTFVLLYKHSSFLSWVSNQACFQPSSKYKLKIYHLLIYNYYSLIVNHKRNKIMERLFHLITKISVG